MKKALQKALSLLLAVVMLASLLPAAFAADAQEAVPADAQWERIQSLISEFADKNTWKTAQYTGAVRQQLPLTALLGNGDIGVTSNGAAHCKSYHLSSTAFWSDNSQDFGYGRRSPQLITGGGVSIYAWDAENNKTLDPVDTSFLEELDIARAEIRTSQYMGKAKVKMVNWLSQEKNIMVTEITSESMADQTMRALTWGSSLHPEQLPTHAGTGTLTNGRQFVWATRTSNTKPQNGTPARWMSEFAMASTVIGDDSAVYSAGTDGSIVFNLPAGKTVYVVTAIECVGNQAVDAATDANGAALANAKSLLSTVKSKSDIGTLRQAQLDWWKNYYLLSWMDLGDTELNRLYYGNQYIFGCCTREGKQAPGLYGVWITCDNIAWQGDYHLNYNFQSPYYGSYSSNRMLTFSEPMFHTFLDYINSGLKRAANTDHLRCLTGNGWYYSTRKDEPAFRYGFTDALLLPVSIVPYANDAKDMQYLNQTIDALFCAIQICTYYNYTLDYDWLTTKQKTVTGSYYSPYDFLAKTANFYVQWVEKRAARVDEEYFKDNPATSSWYQQLPTKYSQNYGKYPEYDEARDGDNYVYVLFDGAHEGSYEFNPTVILGNLQYLTDTLAGLGENTAKECSYAERYAQWKDLSEHLVSPSVSAYTHSSGLRVFGLSEDRGIRDISATVELEWVHPGYQLGFNSDPTLLETARNTVTVMGDMVSPGYGSINNTPKIFTQAARVGYDAKTLIARLKTYCVNKMAANNYINDGVHGWEKAGVLEALNTMMCMSDGGIIKTFPTWTGDNAQFHAIRMPGAFLVSSQMYGQKVQYIDVTSEKGGKLKLVIPWDTDLYNCTLTDTTNGKTVLYTTAVTENSNDPYLTVSTEAGHTYRLTSGQPVTGTPKVPVDLTAAAVSETEISVSWRKNPEEGDNVSYRVSVTDAQGKTTNHDTDNLTLSVTGLTPGTKYAVRVQALYTPERASEWTDAVTVLLAPENTEKPVLMEVTAPEAVNAALGTTAEALSAMLPGTVTTQIYDSATGDATCAIPVVWDLSTYDPDSTARQTFPGTLQLDDTYSNLFDLTVQITVRLQDNKISVTGESKNLNDLLNLTELGTADWMQICAQGTALAYYRKNNNAGLISDVTYVNNNNCTDPYASAEDYAIRTCWTDGTPQLAKTYPLATDNIGAGQSAGARYVGNYVEFTVKAQPFEQTLTLSLGAWQSKSTLEMWFSKSPESKTTAVVDSQVDKIGGGLQAAHYANKGAKLFTVKFSASDPDEKLVIRYGVTNDYDYYKKGQAVIQAFALSGTPVLTVADTKNGRLTVSNDAPNTGDRIVITVTPDEHYVLRKGTLKQNEAEITKTEDGYSFTMPYAMVTISAEFASVATLETLMQRAEQRLENEDLLAAIRKALNDALADARTILDEGCASDEEIAAAEAALKVAIEMPNTTAVTGVTLDKSVLTLTEGKNAQLTAVVAPETADNKTVQWTSSDNGVATVDENGSVTAVKAGTATITVTTMDGGFTAECTVTVKARQPEQDPILPIISSLPGLTKPFPFKDVPKTAWYYREVKGAWEKNLIDGVTSYEFRPDAELTVAQAIKLSAALHQLNETGKVTLKNGAGAWYSTYAAYAVDNGIIEASYLDYTDAQMNAAISRAEFVHIFYGAMRDYAVLNTVADNAIPDVKTTDRFADEIYTFYCAGILTGSDAKGTFHAESNIKRSEVATILYRMFEPSARKTIKLP